MGLVVCCRSGVSSVVVVVMADKWVRDGGGCGGRGGVCGALVFDVVGWWADHQFI